MIQIFNLLLDPTSFWLGFVMGIVFLFLIFQARSQSTNIIRSLRSQFETLRESLSAGTKSRLMDDLHNYAQKQHLAAGLFPFHQIAIPPRLMPLPVGPGAAMEFVQEEITNQVLPYMPDWPEAAAAFHAPTISLAEALEGGANLLLIGQAGSGKSAALAHLASAFAVGEPSIAKLSHRFPILLQAAEILSVPANPDLLAIIGGAISAQYASPLVQPRLGSLLKSLFSEGSALLLLDGFDEFEPGAGPKIKSFIGALLKTYPKIQLVVTASLENYAGLNQLGLIPTALAAWDDHERIAFSQNWGSAWVGLQKEVDQNDPAKIMNNKLINYWLENADIAATPLELTLKNWAAFAGDLASPDLPKLIETHLSRLTGSMANSRAILEKLALHMLANQKTLLSQKETDLVIRSAGDIPIQPALSATEETSAKKAKDPKAKTSGIPPILENLVDSGILVLNSKDQIRFLHPVFTAYLAGCALAKDSQPERVTNQPGWQGKNLSLGFWGCFAEITPVVNLFLEDGLDLPIKPELFQVARWLRLPIKNQAWRAGVMRSLANLMYKDFATTGLSYRAMTALATSGDQTVNGLFRQMEKSDNPDLRQLAALGLGLLNDARSTPNLTNLSHDTVANVGRAACLALVRIGTKPAVDAVIGVLLHASEELRRAAAEAISAHPEEGLPILKEALTMPDLLVRRAAIFGLMRMNSPEVFKLLESTAVSDGQWVVRNLAVQGLEQKRLPNPYIIKTLPPIIDLPWLLVYAAHSGIGIVNEKDAMEMVIKAVERGEHNEKLEALQFLALCGDQIAARAVYNVFFGSTAALRSAAYNTIWHLNASGVTLPPPQQFGLN